MQTAYNMAVLYDENRAVCSKYVHSTSRGHEAIQLAAAFQLQEFDFAAPYYRDESILLGIGMKPYELMLQLMGKKDDPFSGGEPITDTLLLSVRVSRLYPIKVRPQVCKPFLPLVWHMEFTT